MPVAAVAAARRVAGFSAKALPVPSLRLATSPGPSPPRLLVHAVLHVPPAPHRPSSSSTRRATSPALSASASPFSSRRSMISTASASIREKSRT